MAFCPRGEFDLLAADLGYLAPGRVETTDPDGYIEAATLPHSRSPGVLAGQQNATQSCYKSGQSIPLTVLGGGELAVDAIFS